MQKIKSIQIGDKSFTVKELPMKTVWGLFNGGQLAADTTTVDRFKTLLCLACPELTEEVLLELYPSEVEELWKGFEEVNAAFLGVMRKVGLIDILISSIKPALAQELNKALMP